MNCLFFQKASLEENCFLYVENWAACGVQFYQKKSSGHQVGRSRRGVRNEDGKGSDGASLDGRSSERQVDSSKEMY